MDRGAAFEKEAGFRKRRVLVKLEFAAKKKSKRYKKEGVVTAGST
jgi:hypothetical protein